MHEVANAVDQADREVANRFDFKGSGSKYERDGAVVTLQTQSDFQLRQMLDILQDKLTRRGIDIACLELGEPEVFAREARQRVTLRQGLDTPLAKRIVKMIKDAKLKVQASIQGEQVRVTGKKKDDLQRVMALLREAELGMPLQFVNFRD